MDIFFKNKFLVRVVAFLLLLNLFSIGYFWIGRKGRDDGQRPKRPIEQVTEILKQELHLTDKQAEDLKKIRQDFFNKEEPLSQAIRAKRDSMNMEMFNENTDTAHVKAIAKRVADGEYQMELYRLEQAQQLKTICTPEQLKKFQGIVIDIRDYFQPQKNK